MKKILIVLNESHVDQHVIKAAINIAKESTSHLEAVFLDDISNENLDYVFPNDLYLTGDNTVTESRLKDSMMLIKDDEALFRDACTKAGIGFNTEIDYSVSVNHLVDLSFFADLIIADAKCNSDEYSFKDVLEDAHCPVLLLSRDVVKIEKIYLAYDGSPSSMYAIKMFSYLFPEYKNLYTTLLHISDDNDNIIPHLDKLKHWTSKHFSNINFESIPGNTKTILVQKLEIDAEKSIIVMGAYGGSSFARLFYKSTSEVVVNKTKASIFMAHE